MSYQLISGYRGQAPTHPPTGAETLSVSDGMPEALQRYLHTRGEELIKALPHTHERQFCYLTQDEYHILSALESHDDGTVIVHHIALTGKEVAAMQRNTSRPTPAGIILALESESLWRTSEEQASDTSLEQPKLTASHLPDASQQQTWKKLTGHKSNATLLLRPPYEGKCMVCTPAYISNKSLLHLIHESTWLTTTRGWGKTFYATSVPLPEAFQSAQLCRAIIGSAHEENHRQKESGIPVLTLLSDLSPHTDELCRSDTGNVTPQGWQQVQIHREELPARREADIIAAPYKYTEAPDYETFDIDEPRSKYYRWSKHIAGLFTLTTLVYLGVSYFVDSAAIPVNDLVPDNIEQQAPVKEFAAIISNAKESDEELQRLRAGIDSGTSPRHAILSACIEILVSDVYKTGGHQDNLLYLLTNSDTLAVKPEDLCRYYLHRATHNYPAEEWIDHNIQPAELKGWHKLFKKFPEISEILRSDNELRKYMRAIIEETYS